MNEVILDEDKKENKIGKINIKKKVIVVLNV